MNRTKAILLVALCGVNLMAASALAAASPTTGTSEAGLQIVAPAVAATSPTAIRSGAPGSPMIATTSPTVARSSDKLSATTAPLIRDADLSVFFPSDLRAVNGASAYTRAFELFATDRARTRFADQWGILLDRPLMRAALEQVTSGSRCQTCDFLPFLPDDLSRSTKFPFLYETNAMARLLAERFNRELGAGQTTAAMNTARALMAFGRHLRMSALVLTQDIQGLAIERMAVRCFQKALRPADDRVTSAKLTLMRRLLDAAQRSITDEQTSHAARGLAFSADLAWLRSPYAVLRCEAILNMAQETLPHDVLVKPTPTIKIEELKKKIEEATSPTAVRLRPDEFKTKIEWPRKGIRSYVTGDDVRRLREALEGAAKSDPDIRVRTLARRFLDTLVEPNPTPGAGGADVLSSPSRHAPP